LPKKKEAELLGGKALEKGTGLHAIIKLMAISTYTLIIRKDRQLLLRKEWKALLI
jgi:hypothetical protein